MVSCHLWGSRVGIGWFVGIKTDTRLSAAPAHHPMQTGSQLGTHETEGDTIQVGGDQGTDSDGVNKGREVRDGYNTPNAEKRHILQLCRHLLLSVMCV